MATKRINFQNALGYQLSAQLELPIDQDPQAFAVFAHCFSCNKNLTAVRRIARALTESGFGVLRFDFTGLGESEGEFADTNFTSNVEDLIGAADFLAAEYSAPRLMVGHSLGGAAAIFAASQLPDVQAVAIVGAPASPEHVKHLFSKSLDDIELQGSATINIAGRQFTIKRQFIDDLSGQNMAKTVGALRKPLLILHSPQDIIVSIENAKAIYDAARHPKSFISLDGADHLLSDKTDASYVGSVIASWAKRYVVIPDRLALKLQKQVLVRIGNEGYTTDIKAGRHTFKADEPVSVGGNDFGPTPYELLLASLGACTAMTLKMYANRKKWNFEEINIHLNHNREYARDCDNCSDPKAVIDRIERSIEIVGDLDEDQLNRLLQIADKCPVHKTLHNEIHVVSNLSLGNSDSATTK